MLEILIVIQLAFAAVACAFLLFINAPYGRFVRSGWGPAIPSRWAWMIMEFPAFFIIAFLVVTHADKAGVFGLLFLLMWESHYVYRVWVYPLLLTSPAKPFPLLLVFFGLCFNTINGLINGWSLIAMGKFYTVNAWASDPRLWTGVALFAVGFAVHARSDRTLRALRRQGNGEYAIPEKGLFRYVASPNYLGEILEWIGWAVATWSMAGLAFALFTIANLVPRAYGNRRWYRQTFPEYPPQRRVIVPFVW